MTSKYLCITLRCPTIYHRNLDMKDVLLPLLLLSILFCSAQTTRTRTVKLMGSRFDITIVSKDSLTAEKQIDAVIAEVSRIENLISDWIPTTQVSLINQNAGIVPVKVDTELILLTERAIEISKLTNGSFDISFAAMERIWKYDGSLKEMPSPETLKKALEKVGYKNIIIDKKASTIFLKLPGMKIGFGALGEGYAADRCRKMMMARGVKAGIVNGSGDMSTWGKQSNGKPWTIGITDPFNHAELYAVVPLKTNAVVTSGSYEKYFELDGKRYSHIINPVSGYPATGLTSVTVFGPSTELANAFSTSIMVMGKEAGFALLKKFPNYSCIMVSDDGKFFTSKGINLENLRVP